MYKNVKHSNFETASVSRKLSDGKLCPNCLKNKIDTWLYYNRYGNLKKCPFAPYHNLRAVKKFEERKRNEELSEDFQYSLRKGNPGSTTCIKFFNTIKDENGKWINVPI